jgi:uncharacterized protein YndB with AHSA1/START domain
MNAKDASDAVAPIRRSISVSWSPDVAFERFTARFATWWPTYALSIGGRRVKQVVFECRAGGRIYEEHADGTRFLWGKVLVLEPPTRVVFTHHASRAESDAQVVEVTFVPEGTGTLVELVATGWEKMSPEARRARSGYRMTWRAALDRYADRFGGTILMFNVMSTAIDAMGQRGTFIRNSLARMPD